MNDATSPLEIKISPYSVKETADRLEQLLHSQQIDVFCRINHSKAASDNNLEMQPEELIIFGSPKVGTALMVERPTIGIELPLKIIIWKEEGKTFIGFHHLDKLLSPYRIEKNKEIISKMQNFLESLVTNTIKK